MTTPSDPRNANEPSPSWGEQDERLIERLIQEAGEREPLAVATAQMKRAVERAWSEPASETPQQDIDAGGRHDRSTLWTWAAVAAVVFGLAWVLWGTLQSSWREPAPQVATLIEAQGSVTINGVSWSQEDADAQIISIRAGDAIITGPDGKIALSVGHQRTLRLDHATSVNYPAQGEISLQRGALYLDADAGARPSEAPRVATPFGSLEEIGTQYEVRVSEEDLTVRVREGQVRYEGMEDSISVHVAAGLALSLSAGEEPIITPLAPNELNWPWVEFALPPVDIDGRPLSELLTWTARQGGWTLRHQDTAAEQEAARIILHGSIDGLSLTEGLELAMEGSGLTASVVGSELLVSRDTR